MYVGNINIRCLVAALKETLQLFSLIQEVITTQ